MDLIECTDVFVVKEVFDLHNAYQHSLRALKALFISLPSMVMSRRKKQLEGTKLDQRTANNLNCFVETL